MEEEWEESEPFWVQSTTNPRRVDRLLSFFFNSGVLVLLLLVTAICFMVFIIPSLLSFSALLYKPNTVKKSWESINIVLVLFALLFAFLSRNKNTDSTFDQYHRTSSNITNGVQKSNPSTPHQWYEYSDRTMLRTSNSYPDLRESQTWVTPNDKWRSLDDTQIYRNLEPNQLLRNRPRFGEHEVQDSVIKNVIHFDTSNDEVEVPPPPSPTQEYNLEEEKIIIHKIPAPPPPPPPPPPPTTRRERKRGGANATKVFLVSLYHKKKKKKQRQKSVDIDNVSSVLHKSPPPPPPLPPPPFFHNLFSSKKGKKKPIPPPPPPPPFRAARVLKPITPIPRATIAKPILPVKVHSFNSVEENSSSGGESPVIGIPAPPPLPPFKMPDWKFVVQGDYVRVRSSNSSRDGSPDLDDVESESSSPMKKPTAVIDEGETTLFCPSPDVDTKADNFIAKFRAGLKLEKIDSFNLKQGPKLSRLGPASSRF